MKRYLPIHARHQQHSGITSVDCAITLFLLTLLAAAGFSEFSAVIPPFVQKVILAGFIWQALSFSVAGQRENQ